MAKETIVSNFTLKGREILSSYAAFTLEGEITAKVTRGKEAWTITERNGIPKGTSDARNKTRVRRMDQRAARVACPRAAQKRMKKTPCPQPTSFTARGRPAKYFNGIAMPKRIRYDAPSMSPMARRRPMGVCSNARPR